MLFQHILVAYDGSPQSQSALDRAVALVGSNPGSRLTVAHAFQYPNLVVGEAMVIAPAVTELEEMADSESVLDEAKNRLIGLPDTTYTLLQGDPAQSILECAKEAGADLIVIGSRGLGTIREWLLGSVSHYVVQHAQIPVLVIK